MTERRIYPDRTVVAGTTTRADIEAERARRLAAGGAFEDVMYGRSAVDFTSGTVGSYGDALMRALRTRGYDVVKIDQDGGS